MEETNPLEGKYIGCLIGLAVGDAFGMPGENKTHNEIVKEFGEIRKYEVGWKGKAPAGSFTDDTEMMVAVSEALLKGNGKMDMKNFEESFRGWYKALYLRDRFKCFGPTCYDATKNLMTGSAWENSGLNSPGNGGAMRVAPIGLLYHDDMELLKKAAIDSTKITHNNPIAIAGSCAIAYAVAQGIKNVNPTQLPKEISNFVSEISPEMSKKIKGLDDLLGKDPKETILKIGTRGYALDSVPASIYCFLSSPRDYYKTISLAANSADDTDSVAAMAGAISGSFNGIKSIPPFLTEGLENSSKGRDYIHKLAKDLARLS